MSKSMRKVLENGLIFRKYLSLVTFDSVQVANQIKYIRRSSSKSLRHTQREMFPGSFRARGTSINTNVVVTYSISETVTLSLQVSQESGILVRWR